MRAQIQGSHTMDRLRGERGRGVGGRHGKRKCSAIFVERMRQAIVISDPHRNSLKGNAEKTTERGDRALYRLSPAPTYHLELN